jgi:hypothetical protein
LEVKKIAAVEKKRLLDRIGAKVETSKNNRIQKAKKKPPMVNPKKIVAEAK